LRGGPLNFLELLFLKYSRRRLPHRLWKRAAREYFKNSNGGGVSFEPTLR